VGHLDVAPTLDRLYGVRQRHSSLHPGLDLSERLHGRDDGALAARDGFVHESAHNRYVVATRGPWKLLLTVFGARDGDEVALFHTGDDPEEHLDLADDHPEIVQELQSLAHRWIELGHWNVRDEKLSAEELEQLRQLGYVVRDDGS
jgi:arylsulfatase A-like enzyme